GIRDRNVTGVQTCALPIYLIGQVFDPTISAEDLKIIREMWPGNIVVKGIQTLADAQRMVDAGVDGIVLSNHGGRQLDRAPIPFHLLPEVVREVGCHTTIMVDTGVMNGADVVAAHALGADFVLVGRAWLYGLMAGGRAGVDKMIEIVKSEILRTMGLLGASTVDELNPEHVRQFARLLPMDNPIRTNA